MISFVKKRMDWVIVFAALAVYMAHSMVFINWIIDDAGVTYSYARNLVHGYGLVSQPGMPPVEGYSDFLWLVMLAPFFKLGIFHPVFIPKLLAAVLVSFTFLLLYRTSLSLTGSKALSALPPLCLALNTSFVVWTASGLENSLYALLLTAAFHLLIKRPSHEGLYMGALVALVGLTRPEGVAYFIVYPLVLAYRHVFEGMDGRERARGSFIYLPAFLLIYGGYEVFRYMYFGDILPNTYYAKAASIASGVYLQGGGGVYKFMSLLMSIFGGFAPVALVVYPILTAFLMRRRECRGPLFLSFLFLTMSVSIYQVMPPDWMREFRFATPVFIFVYMHLFLMLKYLADTIRLRPAIKSSALAVIALSFIVSSAAMFHRRSDSYIANPDTSFYGVAKMYYMFERYEEEAGIHGSSLLLTDIGGPLYYSSLKLYDMGMVCDRTVARTLFRDKPKFYDYVFEKIKPTFIHIPTDSRAKWYEFDNDPRFRKDYAAVIEWKEQETGLPVGDYIRRDALKDAGTLDRLRELWKK